MSKRSSQRSSRRSRNSNRRTQRRNKTATSDVNYQSLEPRYLLAFDMSLIAGTLTLTQTSEEGTVTIDNDGLSQEFRTMEGINVPVTHTAATNLVVNLLDSISQLNLNFNNPHDGFIEINAANGDRVIRFGGSQFIGGDLTVNAGSGAQDVFVSDAAPFDVRGTATFALGSGVDSVSTSGFGLLVSNDLVLTGVNGLNVSNDEVNVGGNLSMNTSSEAVASAINISGTAVASVGGDLIYQGGDGVDDLLLNHLDIGGNLNVNLGAATDAPQDVELKDGGSVGGTTMVDSGTSVLGDIVNFELGSTLTGDMTLNLGDGPNTAKLFGTFNGSTVMYTGGEGVDTFKYDFSGNPADVIAILGNGNDHVTLGPNASIAPTTLSIDFGNNDNDAFENHLGAFTFNAVLSGLLGFDHVFDSTTNTMTSTETTPLASGIATIGPDILRATTNIVVDMTDDSGTEFEFDLDQELTGNAILNLGNGDRVVNLIGSTNSFGGDLTVNAGVGNQSLELTGNSDLSVTGNGLFNLGTGDDSVFDEAGFAVAIDGDLTLTDVNQIFFFDGMSVGGNLLIDSSAESVDSTFEIFDSAATPMVVGDLTYNGGASVDQVLLGIFNVGGNLSVNLGEGTSTGLETQTVELSLGTIGGTTKIESGDSTNGDWVDFQGGTFEGDITINLGEGLNDVFLLGTFNGTDVMYFGGSGIDNVFYGLDGNPATVNSMLGLGDDSFTLEAGASISAMTLRVDFGGGVDEFLNNFGKFNFDANLVNFDNFNRHYRTATDQWILSQLVDDGDVIIGNNGMGGIGITNNYETFLSPADSVRLHLLNDSTGNVEVDLESFMPGDVILSMGSGSGDVNFTGFDNQIGGDLMIEAAEGNQTVNLAVNTGLHVTGSAVINLREGVDVVNDGNGIVVGGSLILRSVNEFEVGNSVETNRFLMNSALLNERARLDNDNKFTVYESLIYIGGTNKDDVFLNDGLFVGGNSVFNLGENQSSARNQVVNLRNSQFGGSVIVTGGESFGGNTFVTDTNTMIDGFMFVDFSANTTNNLAILDGIFGGNDAVYRGGAGVDTVTLSLSGSDADVYFHLGAEDDKFNLWGDTMVNLLFGNFGDGADTFNDDFDGAYPFTTFLNTP